MFTFHGPVAQLGAHYIRIVGVGSSNLLRSTKKKTPFGVFFFGMVFTQRRFEDQNATRMSVARCGWTQRNHNFRQRRKCKRISSSPEIKCIFPLDKCTHVGYNNPNIDKAFEQKPVTV